MISIIVPIYNGEKYIKDCIQSVLEQKCNDWELILINDGSVDGTYNVCSQFLNNSNIKYFFKPNSGVQKSRWYGLSKAKGDWVMFLDADDCLYPYALDIFKESIDEEANIVVAKKANFKNSINEHSKRKSADKIRLFSDKYISLKQILRGRFLSSLVGSLYRRDELLKEEKIFCNGLSVGEDLMFNLEYVLKSNPRIKLIPDYVYGYRYNESSVMHTFNKNKYDNVFNLIQYLENYVSTNNLYKILKREYGFRMLLLWSTFVFHQESKYYSDKSLRKIMQKLYFPAFPFLYSYLKYYLFIDFFLRNRAWK